MRSLVAAVAVTSLISCGPSAGTLASNSVIGRIFRLGRRGHQPDLQREIADVRFGMIDHREFDVQLARRGLRNAVSGQFQILGQRMLVRDNGIGGLRGASLLGLRGVGAGAEQPARHAK